MVDVSTGEQACGIGVGGVNVNSQNRGMDENASDGHKESQGTVCSGESSMYIEGTVTPTSMSEFGDDKPPHSFQNPNEQLSMISSSKKEVVKGSKMMQTFAGVAGNILEWYDFAVFGYFSDVIGDVFFPEQEGHAAMIETFTIFGLAFFMRPIGGVLLGYIGDKYGRKRALEISIFLMAFPTFAMGCLPTYDQVGIWAVVLLTLVRLLQGLSVGGQLVSSLVYTLENNPKEKWGLYGSFVMAAANFGTLLGGIVSCLMRAVLSEDQLKSWGWRIPFLSGILVSTVGLYLRYYCDDDSVGHGGGNHKSNPIKEAFSRQNLRSLIAASLVPMLWAGGFYMSFVWMATFMDTFIEIPGAFGINSVALLLSVCALFPVAGMLSDKYGRERTMYTGGVLMGIFSPIMIILIAQGDPVLAFCSQLFMGVALSLWGAPMCAWLVEAFPPSIRLTSVAAGYNIAQAFVGGSSPAVATFLVDAFGNYSPGIMVSVMAALSVLGLRIAPTQAKAPEKNTQSLFSDYSDDEYDSPSRTLDGDVSCDVTTKELV